MYLCVDTENKHAKAFNTSANTPYSSKNVVASTNHLSNWSKHTQTHTHAAKSFLKYNLNCKKTRIESRKSYTLWGKCNKNKLTVYFAFTMSLTQPNFKQHQIVESHNGCNNILIKMNRVKISWKLCRAIFRAQKLCDSIVWRSKVAYCHTDNWHRFWLRQKILHSNIIRNDNFTLPFACFYCQL